MNLRALALTLGVALTLAAPALCATTEPPAPRPGVNAVLGDDSYVARFGVPPAPGTNETLRLATHLAYVEARLRASAPAGLTTAQRAERARNLARLRAYVRAGVFPRNHGYPGRRPHFIDEDGRICAVGFLVAQSAGRPAAEEINRAFEWAYVPELHGAAFDRWAEASGLTREELAMIQPSYEWERSPTAPNPPVAQPPRPIVRPTEAGLQSALSAARTAVQNCYRASHGRPRAVQVGVVLLPAGELNVSILGANEHGGAVVPFAESEPAAARCIEQVVRNHLAALTAPFAGRPVAVTQEFAPPGASTGAVTANGPDSERFRAAMNRQLGRIAACLPPPPPRAGAGFQVEFHATAQTDGALDEVRIEAPGLGQDDTIVSCLAAVVQSVRIPGARAQPTPVAYSLHLGRR